MKKLIDLAIRATVICMITIAVDAAENIPFPEALEEANVSLSSIDDGQRESLMLGNGDLYGIIWEKDGGLYMRITRNDIWDARIDTSEDGDEASMEVGAAEQSTGYQAKLKVTPIASSFSMSLKGSGTTRQS